MKHLISLIVLSLNVLFASGQTAYINGTNNSATAVCNGSTKFLTASISGGFTTGDSLMWIQQINGGTPTTIAHVPYVNDTITVPRTTTSPYTIAVATTGNAYFYTLNVKRGTSTFTANITITVNPSPTLYNVTGGGNYCTGGTGVTINLSGSQSGTNYQLMLNGSSVGSSISGTGSGISFGSQTSVGTYTIQATIVATGCTILMNSSTTVGMNPIPSVIISSSGPTTFCSPGSVTLTATTASGNTFQWQNNGSNISGATNNQYIANVTGMYKVIVTNSYGCTNSDDTLVTVNPLPLQFTVSASSSTFCQGGTGVTINLSGSQSGTNYQLMLNGSSVGSSISGTGSALSWPGQTSSGTYTIKAVNTITSCTDMMTGSAVVSMNPLPNNATAITGPTSICQNTNGVYSTNALLNTLSYVWSVPNGATIISGQGTTSITVKFNNATSGNISVFGQNACGDGQSSSLTVTVNPAPTVTVTASSATICAGATVTLTANGNGNAFLWSTGGTTQTISVSPLVTTTYYVTVTSNNTCTTSGNITITVNPLPIVSLTLTQDNFCTDVNSTVLSGGSPIGGIYTGTGVVNGLFYPPVVGTGTYIITYTYTNGIGCSNSATDLVTVNPIPAVTFLNVPGTIHISTPPFYLTGYVSPVGGTFSGPGVIGGLFSPAIAGIGIHMITYKYVHPISGCSATQIQYIAVSGTTGISGVNPTDVISMYPNPTSSLVNLSGINTQKIKSLKIMSILGEVVYTTVINDEKMTIDVSDYSSGMYIISFITTDGISIGKRFVKE